MVVGVVVVVDGEGDGVAVGVAVLVCDTVVVVEFLVENGNTDSSAGVSIFNGAM